MKKFYGFILLTIFIFFCSCGEKEEGFDFSLLNQFHYETDSVNITITGIKDDEVEQLRELYLKLETKYNKLKEECDNGNH